MLCDIALNKNCQKAAKVSTQGSCVMLSSDSGSLSHALFILIPMVKSVIDL